MYNDLKAAISGKGRCYLFLDELQEIDGWEKAVNDLLESCDVDIYVTGSNSKLMSGEISTYLTVRYVSIPVYTLSFMEYIEFKKKDPSDARNVFDEYIQYGGFPVIGISNFDTRSAYQIVEGIYASVITRDISKRRGYDVYIGKNSTKEIDFVGVRRDERVYVQVCVELPAHPSREIDNLMEIKDHYHKYVVCRDPLAVGNNNGIEIVHIADFLLRENW